MYPVVSDNVRKRYVRDRGRLVYQGAGHAIGVDVREVGHKDHGHSLQHSEGGAQGHGQHIEVGAQGHGQHSGEGDQVGDLEVGVQSGLKKHLAGHVKSCQFLRSRKTYEDFEQDIYLHHALKFDWRELFENLDDDEVEEKRNSEGV